MGFNLDDYARPCVEYVEEVATKVSLSLSWMSQVWQGKYMSLDGESAKWAISSTSKKNYHVRISMVDTFSLGPALFCH